MTHTPPTPHIDLTPTPEACREIARRFKVQQAQSEALVETADQALDELDGLDDGDLGPWPRALLEAAFAALGEIERARVQHMREGLDALGPYADEAEL